MSDAKDPPIEEVDFRYGATVIDMADLRLARGMSRRPHSLCKHLHLTYDTHERRIWCQDCERDVDGFDVVVMLADRMHDHDARMKRRWKELVAAEKNALVSRASKAVDDVWRRRSMVPACPSCGEGLLPEAFANGCQSLIGREFAEARIKQKKAAKEPK